MSKRFKESSERSDEVAGTRSLLSRLSSQHLKSIKVAICRHNVPEPTTPAVVQRALEDPKELVIHRREGEGQHPIFDRRGIVVNVEKHLEERIVLKSPIREDANSKRSHSKTYSDRTPSPESYRSQSPRNRRRYSRTPSPRKDSKTKPGHSKEYGRVPKVSPSRIKSKSSGGKEEYKRHTEASSSTKRSNRSVSPNYKRTDIDNYESRSSPKERYYHRERSPKPGPSKNSRERERSPKERRDNEGFRKDKYKGSPKRIDYRDASPKRYDNNRSQSPRSPKKLNYKHTDKEKYTRPRSPPPSAPTKRYSVSPHSRRRSRSPHSRRHSPSPHSKRHSRSPHFKRTPPREVRGMRDSSASGSKTRRRSSSPYERDRDYPSSSGHHPGHNRPPYPKRRSRSPYSRKHSRSPHRTDSGYKYRKRSRSPSRRDSDSYHRGRSRSPGRKSAKRSESEERSYEAVDKNEYRGLPPDFDYYGAEGFWIPAPLPRPGFMPRGVLPPMAIPRPMIRPGPSYIIPRPYMPMPPHPLHQFRTRFPVAYNRPYRPRLTAPTVTTSSSTNTVTTSTVVKPTSTSTVAVSTASTSTSSNPIIEEPVSESENVESTVQDKP